MQQRLLRAAHAQAVGPNSIARAHWTPLNLSWSSSFTSPFRLVIWHPKRGALLNLALSSSFTSPLGLPKCSTPLNLSWGSSFTHLIASGCGAPVILVLGLLLHSSFTSPLRSPQRASDRTPARKQLLQPTTSAKVTAGSAQPDMASNTCESDRIQTEIAHV